jgi:PHYB activation tagged suppressor 1
MVAAAAAAVLATWAFNALVQLVWRPRAVARRLRAQGVSGPGYRFFSGNLGEMRRLRAGAAGATLDAGDHDFIPVVYPHHSKWISQYGTLTHRIASENLLFRCLLCSSVLVRYGGERLQQLASRVMIR